MPREHVIDPGRIHHAWDASLEPTLVDAGVWNVGFTMPRSVFG